MLTIRKSCLGSFLRFRGSGGLEHPRCYLKAAKTTILPRLPIRCSRAGFCTSSSGGGGNKLGGAVNTAKSAADAATAAATAAFNRSTKRIRTNLSPAAIIILSSIITSSVIYLVYGSSIRAYLVNELANFVAEALKDRKIQSETETLANAVIQQILYDASLTAKFAEFLREASMDIETQTALQNLTLQVLQHPDTIDELRLLTRKLVKVISADSEITKDLSVLFSKSLDDPVIYKAVVDLLADLVDDKEVIEMFNKFLRSVIKEKKLIEATGDFVTETSSAVLKDTLLIESSKSFVSNIVTDQAIASESSKLIQTTVIKSVTPPLIQAAGAAIVAVSMYAMMLLFKPY